MTDLVKDDGTLPAERVPDPLPPQRADTVFSVLAQRASERSPAELWTTTIGGSVNAVFIWWQHPSLHWLGAGFTAAAAYGIWGLTDRAIAGRDPSTEPGRSEIRFLRGIRGALVPIGVVSAVVAIGSFMAVALRGWNH